MSEAGTEQTGPRSMGEIEDSFAQMLTGAEEQSEEDSPQGEQPSTDSSELEPEIEAELADDSVVDEEGDDLPEDEQFDDDTQKFTVTVDGESEEVPLDELIAGYHRYST